MVAAVITTGTELDQQLALATSRDVAALAGAVTPVNGIAVRLNDLFDAPRWRWQLLQTLSARFWVTDWTTSHGNLYSAIQLSRKLILMLMASIIAVAAFNVVSSLVLVVTDRSHSIAMLRAVGATRGHVVLVYLTQGAVIGGLGALGGSALGALLSSVAPGAAEAIGGWMGRPLLDTDVYPVGFLPVAMQTTDFILVSLTALLLCVFAAVLPAWRAAQLSVATTLAR
jgi:lipoprotein-releasing system permease protein